MRKQATHTNSKYMTSPAMSQIQTGSGESKFELTDILLCNLPDTH